MRTGFNPGVVGADRVCSLKLWVIMLAANVVENTTDKLPAGSTVVALLPVVTKTQLLEAGKAALQHADGVLGAQANTCQLVVEIAPVRRRTFRLEKGTNDPCGVFHSLITEQILSSREVHLWVAMPAGKRLYEGVGCRARAALHDVNQVPIPVACCSISLLPIGN